MPLTPLCRTGYLFRRSYFDRGIMPGMFPPLQYLNIIDARRQLVTICRGGSGTLNLARDTRPPDSDLENLVTDLVIFHNFLATADASIS